jgi:hypothetical protein
MKQSQFDYWLTVDPRSKHLFPLLNTTIPEEENKMQLFSTFNIGDKVIIDDDIGFIVGITFTKDGTTYEVRYGTTFYLAYGVTAEELQLFDQEETK